jgi:branched-subunit amino acid aminotransferase/4-amino-4-deoxychorismate lyase
MASFVDFLGILWYFYINSMAKVIFNGKIIDEQEAKISIADKGYFFDFSVYSSIKVIQGKLFFPEYHVSRLFESAKLINLEHSFKKNEIISWLYELVREDTIKDSLLRIVLIGDPDDNHKAKIFIFSIGGLTFYSDKLYKFGSKVITYNGERRVSKSKTKDLLMSFMAYREAKKQNAIDALLIDNEGNIREGTRSNFFVIKNQTIITPPADKVLEGITKKIILEVTKNDFNIKYEDIPLESIKNCDECFISSTSMNVMPIKQIDNIVFETNFEKTHLIGKLFKDFYNKEVFDR